MSGGTLCPRARCPGGHSARGDILPSDNGQAVKLLSGWEAACCDDYPFCAKIKVSA